MAVHDKGSSGDQGKFDKHSPSQLPQRGATASGNHPLPRFVRIIALVECVMVLIGVVIEILQLISLINSPSNDGLTQFFANSQVICDWILLGVMVGAVIGFFSKKTWGKYLGWGAVVLTILSITLFLGSCILRFEEIEREVLKQFGKDDAGWIGYGAFALILGSRVIYVGIYSIAAVQYSRFIKRRNVEEMHAA